MKLKLVVYLGCLMLLTSCTATLFKLSPGGSQIEVGQRDPDAGLQETGPTKVSHGHGCGGLGAIGNYEGAYTLLRNRATELRADYVQIILVS